MDISLNITGQQIIFVIVPFVMYKRSETITTSHNDKITFPFQKEYKE